MNELINYIIPFKGLSSGKHSYQFRITDKFFEAMQSYEIHPTEVVVDLELDYQEGLITLDFSGEGSMVFPCDVCLEDFPLPISYERRVVIKTGEGESDDDDILLCIPIRKVHPLDEEGFETCDPVQLAYLKKLNENKIEDHRWDALKNLKFED